MFRTANRRLVVNLLFMSDVIRLLPDTVANQIAAGEVIQRPASAVKEMLENAVDAGATRIQLILAEAGKTLIQVVDDGDGMSENDARICFERHATSKLRKIDDLYILRTMGFRGEALASIASVAMVDLKTRQREAEVGYHVVMEGGQCKVQEQIAHAAGTSIAVKNLFYNVPARRNFLKSDPVEFRHVQDEFIRVALSNPEISFALQHDNSTIFDLRSGNFRARITAIFGSAYQERLVPVEEDTSIVRIEGYVGKPEFAKKTRGEQYFFVNGRFVKDGYLHHAVTRAFEDIISRDAFPSYWLKLTVSPAEIDVNIHPTKTEIKFSHEKDIYPILRAAVKRSLGKYSIAPSLDFDREPAFDLPLKKLDEDPVMPSIRINPDYNPFRKAEGLASINPSSGPGLNFRGHQNRDVKSWLEAHRAVMQSDKVPVQQELETGQTSSLPELLYLFEELDDFRFVQVGPALAVAAHSRGIVLFDLPGARERILYEKFVDRLSKRKSSTQRQLFPVQVLLSPADFLLVQELSPELLRLGFEIGEFGKNTIVIQGLPEGVEPGTERSTVETLLEQYRANQDKLKLPLEENIARSMALSVLRQSTGPYSSRELRQIAIELMHCEHPYTGVNGRKIINLINTERLSVLLGSRED